MVQLFLADKPEFQSTLPARGATRTIKKSCKNIWISIHAPRTGSDRCNHYAGNAGKYFNPRSPHGERLIDALTAQRIEAFQSTLPARGATAPSCVENVPKLFQSTLPARGATLLCYHFSRRKGISIHAPRTGSDNGASRGTDKAGNFNPRSPHGERHAVERFYALSPAFQSTLPARGATPRSD